MKRFLPAIGIALMFFALSFCCAGQQSDLPTMKRNGKLSYQPDLPLVLSEPLESDNPATKKYVDKTVPSLNVRNYANIQAAITTAGTTGSVVIPADYAGVDTYSNPNGIAVTDLRVANDDTGRLITFGVPWKLNASGNLTTLATCIGRGECTVSALGNSVLGGGGGAYENSVFYQMMKALRQRFPAVIWHFKNYTLGGRGVQNATPYTTNTYVSLPLCPENTPSCYTMTATGNYVLPVYNLAYGYAFPPAGVATAKQGPPYLGADDYPWEKWAAPDYQGWVHKAVLDAPDALVLLFGMNDEAISGATFTADIKNLLVPFLALTKVPSIVLVTNPNGSVSSSGLNYFSQTGYAHLEESAQDLRGMATQYNYALVDAARVFSALRDGSDPATSVFEYDGSGFQNFNANWNVQFPENVTLSPDYFKATINATGSIYMQRKVASRDNVISAVFDITDANVVPEVQWRAPVDSSNSGFQALLFNHGDGTGTLSVYGPITGSIDNFGVTDLDTEVSIMVRVEGAKYTFWVNAKLVGTSFAYDVIDYGYAGVGVTTLTVGTPYTSSISYVNFEPGSPMKSCNLPINNRQAATPCAASFTSDQSLYGFTNDYGSNTRSLGGNGINHPSIVGTETVFGIALAPFLNAVSFAAASRPAKLYPVFATQPTGSCTEPAGTLIVTADSHGTTCTSGTYTSRW